ncbi:MAG: delta-aminolevulinic acid dehydratase [Halieaceae bacterium]
MAGFFSSSRQPDSLQQILRQTNTLHTEPLETTPPHTRLREHRLLHTVLTLLAGLIFAAPSLDVVANEAPESCQCLWQGSFTDVAPTSDLVVVGEVAAVRGNAVDMSIEEISRGPDWLTDIRVWTKTGDYCRPPPDGFTPGSRWMLALEKITDLPEGGFDPSTPNQSFGRVGDYALSACGGYFLEVYGNTATGNLLPDMPRWAYDPKMNPVVIDLITSYLDGSLSIESLQKASREDPAARELLLDTKSFLRGQDPYLED